MASKIILFIPDLTIGGAEKVTVNLANRLVENGHRVEILLIHKQGRLVDKITSNIEISVLPASRMRWAAIPLAWHLRQTKPDVVISSMTGANVITIIASRLAQVSARIIVTEHSTQWQQRSARIKRDITLAKYTYRFSDYVVGVSKGVSERIRNWARVPDNKIVTIYNPAITKEQIGTVYDPPSHQWFHDNDIEVVLSVGRHVEEKDYQTLIRAFSRLSEERDKVRLVLLGGGDLTPKYESLANNLGVREKIWMPGFVTEPYPYMAHANVFALSSRVESLSLVLIEAMACGTPVVSTDCPNGPSEVLVDGEYGELVPTADPESLKIALERTLSAPIDEEKLHQRARDFSVDKATAHYENLFPN